MSALAVTSPKIFIPEVAAPFACSVMAPAVVVKLDAAPASSEIAPLESTENVSLSTSTVPSISTVPLNSAVPSTTKYPSISTSGSPLEPQFY